MVAEMASSDPLPRFWNVETSETWPPMSPHHPRG
jgi:hypothetical protein